MMADAVSTLAADAQTLAPQGRVLVARISPLDLLMRRAGRCPDAASEWNAVLAESLPAWAAAGWGRTAREYTIAEGRDEIRAAMMSKFISGLVDGGAPHIAPAMASKPEVLRSWAEPMLAYEPVLEHRRGPRLTRASAVRRYDEAYRTALRTRGS